MKKNLFIITFLASCVLAKGQSEELLENYNKYLEHYEKGQYELALPYAKKALELEIVELGKKNPEYGISLNNLAEVYVSMGEYEMALPLYLEALDNIKNTLGIEHPRYGVVLNNLAYLYESLGKYELALALNLEALEITKNALGKAHPDYGFSLNNLARVYKSMGEYEQAMPIYREALENTENDLGKEHPRYGIILNNLAQLYESMGEYEKALPLYLEALENTKNALGKEHPDYAISLDNLAYLYESMGDYEKAFSLYLEALENTKNSLGKEHPDYGIRLNNLAGLYESMGEYEKALPLYLGALEITKKALGKKHPDYGLGLNNLADLYESMDEYKKALPLYLEALENTKNSLGKEHPRYGIILSNLAYLYDRMGEYEKALPLYLEALENTKNSLGKEHPSYGVRLENLAYLYKSMGEYEKALPLNIESLENTRNSLGLEHPDYGISLDNIADLYKIMGEYQKALPFYLEANKNLLNQMVHVFRFRSENEKQQFLETILYHFEIYQSFGYLTKHQFQEISTLNLNNQLLLKGLLANSSRTIFEDLKQLKDSSVDGQIEDFKTTLGILAHQYSLALSQRMINIDSLNSVAEMQEAKLVKLHSSKFDQTRASNWKDVQATLKSGEVAIEFSHFHYHNQNDWTDSTLYVAYLIKPELDRPEVVYLFEENELDKVVRMQSPKGLYAVRGADDANENIQFLSQALYNLVWAPLESYLEPGDVVYYSPSGKLNQIAMGALPDTKGNLALTKYCLYQNNSSNNLVNGNAQPAKTPAVFAGGIVYDFIPNVDTANIELDDKYNPKNLLADAKRNQRGISWDYLQGTKNETAALTDMYLQNNLNTTLIGGEQATEAWFKSLDGSSPRVLHLATHGFFFENPKNRNRNSGQQPVYTLASDPLMRSGLLLAHANYAWQNGSNPFEEEDGILSAYEISHMDLRNTDLVVLSACETGLGDIEGSEGVYGLQRAFKMAGVNYIIMSLWSVPDKETADFMQLFYGHWLGGKPIRDAFNQTQKDMNAKYKTHPEKWAAFVLIE